MCRVAEISWHVSMLRVKIFMHILSRGMKPGFTITNQNPKDNPWNGDTHPLLPRIIQIGAPYQKTYAGIVLGY
jgi:hypothetical protein